MMLVSRRKDLRHVALAIYVSDEVADDWKFPEDNRDEEA